MKKIFFLLCCICLIGAAVYLIQHPAPPDVEPDYSADYLPEDTLFLLELTDLQGMTERFPASALGRLFSKPVMYDILRELGGTDEDVQQYDNLYDGLADVLTNPAVREIFGDDAVIALHAPDPAQLRQNPIRALQDSLLVFGTSSTAGPIGRVARVIMSNDVIKTSISGLDMTRIRLDENELLYGYTKKGILLLAYDPKKIVAAVHRKEDENGKDLRQAVPFAATAEFRAEAGQGHVYARTYLNTTELKTLLRASGNQELSREQKEANASLEGVTAISGVLAATQGELRLRAQAEYDTSSLPETAKDSHKALPEKNFSLSLLNEKTLLYSWFSALNNEAVRRLLFKADAEQKYAEFQETVQKELGLSLDRLIKAAGPQAGIAVHEIINAGIVPLPKTVLFFQIRDRTAVLQEMKKLRKKITEQGFAKEQKEEIQGHTLYYWTVMPIEATHLAIGLTDTMLYIANGETGLRALLTSQQEPTALDKTAATAFGETAGQCIAGANQFTFLLRPQLLAEQGGTAADWLADMTLSDSNISIKKTLEAVLQLMRSVDLVAVCSDREEDHASFTAVLQNAAELGQKAQ
ncbi:MAG: hypothetical protein ACL93V_13775 [Candidatus Electrothrix sp. YB6]